MTRWVQRMCGIVAVGVLIFTGVPRGAADPVVERSLAEFLAAQGTFCLPDSNSPGGCFIGVPPLDNFLIPIDPTRNYCAVVDYAGIANRWIVESTAGAVDLGTLITGRVKEKLLPDGRVKITVSLVAADALIWVVAGDPQQLCKPATDPVLFGNRVTDVADGATPAVGTVMMHLDLFMPGPGLPFPDLLQVLFFPFFQENLESFTISAHARGELRAAFGVPDGTEGSVRIQWRGDFRGFPHEEFPAEIIVLRD